MFWFGSSKVIAQVPPPASSWYLINNILTTTTSSPLTTTTTTAVGSAPVCSPSTQTVVRDGVTGDATAHLTATGGDGTYFWSAPSSYIGAYFGANISPTYASTSQEPYIVEVSSAEKKSANNCLVTVINPSPIINDFNATNSINSGEKFTDPITLNWSTADAEKITVQYLNSSNIWTDLTSETDPFKRTSGSFSFTPNANQIVSNQVKTRLIAYKAYALDTISNIAISTINNISCDRAVDLKFDDITTGPSTKTIREDAFPQPILFSVSGGDVQESGLYRWKEGTAVTTIQNFSSSLTGTYNISQNEQEPGLLYNYQHIVNTNPTYCNNRNSSQATLTVTQICPANPSLAILPDEPNINRDTPSTINYSVSDAYGDITYKLIIKEKWRSISSQNQVLYTFEPPDLPVINGSGSYTLTPNTLPSLEINKNYQLIFEADRSSTSGCSTSVSKDFEVVVSPAVIVNFSADPTEVRIGDDPSWYENSTLSWTAENADALRVEVWNLNSTKWDLLQNASSAQLSSGSTSLHPTDAVIDRISNKIQTRLVASRAGSTDTVKTLDISTISVTCPTQIATTITADDAVVRKPGGTNISWTSDNDPDNVRVSYIGNFLRGESSNPNGNIFISPTQSGLLTYSVTAQKAYCKDKTASVQIEVIEPCPTVDYFRFKDSQSTTIDITPGELVTFEWNILNNPTEVQYSLDSGVTWSSFSLQSSGSYSQNVYGNQSIQIRFRRNDCSSNNWQVFANALNVNLSVPPLAPVIYGPDNSTEFNSKPASGVFNWSSVSSEGYTLEIFDTQNSNIKPINTAINSTDFSWSDADWAQLTDSSYSWRVRANSSNFTVAEDGYWVNSKTEEKMTTYPKAWSEIADFVKLTTLGDFNLTTPVTGTIQAFPPTIIWSESKFADRYIINIIDTSNSANVLTYDISGAGIQIRQLPIPLADWKNKLLVGKNYNISVTAKRGTNLSKLNDNGRETLIKKELRLSCAGGVDISNGSTELDVAGDCSSNSNPALSYNTKPRFNWYSQSAPSSVLGQTPAEIDSVKALWVKQGSGDRIEHSLSQDNISNGTYSPPTTDWRALESGSVWSVTIETYFKGEVIISSNTLTIFVPIENPILIRPLLSQNVTYYSKPADTDFMWTDVKSDQTYQIYFYKNGSTSQEYILSTTIQGQNFLEWTEDGWDTIENGNYTIYVKRTTDSVSNFSNQGAFVKAQLEAPIFSSTVADCSMFFQNAPSANTYYWNDIANANDYIVQLRKGDNNFSSVDVSDPLKNTPNEKEISISISPLDFNLSYNGREGTLWSELENGDWYMRVAGRVFPGQTRHFVWSNVLCMAKQTPTLSQVNAGEIINRETVPEYSFSPKILPDDLEAKINLTGGENNSQQSIDIGRIIAINGSNKVQLDDFAPTMDQWKNFYFGDYQVYYTISTKSDHIERARSNALSFKKLYPDQPTSSVVADKTKAIEKEKVMLTIDYPRSEVAYDHQLPDSTISPFTTTNSLEIDFSGTIFDLDSDEVFTNPKDEIGNITRTPSGIKWNNIGSESGTKIISIPMAVGQSCGSTSLFTAKKIITPQFGSTIESVSGEGSVSYDCPTANYEITSLTKTRTSNQPKVKPGDTVEYNISYSVDYQPPLGGVTLLERIKNISKSISNHFSNIKELTTQKAQAVDETVIFANLDRSGYDISNLVASAKGLNLVLDGRNGEGGDFIFNGEMAFELKSLRLQHGAKIVGTGKLNVSAIDNINICRSCSIFVKGYGGGVASECLALGGSGSEKGEDSSTTDCDKAGSGGNWTEGGAGGGGGGGSSDNIGGAGGGGGNHGYGAGAFGVGSPEQKNFGGGAAGIGGTGGNGMDKTLNGSAENGSSVINRLQKWVELGKKLTPGGGGGAGGSGGNGKNGGGVINLSTSENGIIYSKGLLSAKGENGSTRVGISPTQLGVGGAGAGGSITLNSSKIFICPIDGTNLKTNFDARGGNSGSIDYNGKSVRSGSGGGGLVSLRASRVIEVGDNEVGSGITTSLLGKLNQSVVSGDNFMGGYNKGEDGLVNLELDGTTGDDATSCSGGFDNSGQIDEPSINLLINNQDLSEINLPSGSEVNLSWESGGATNIKLSSSDGKINNQDVTGQSSFGPIILDSDISFTITATNANGATTSDFVKIYQFGSESMPKGIFLLDVPEGMSFADGEIGWDSRNDPTLWSQSGNTFSGSKTVSFNVDVEICSAGQKIKNTITIVPYLGSFENNYSSITGPNSRQIDEAVECGVSIGGNIRAKEITGEITPKDNKPSLLIIGEDSTFNVDNLSSNVATIKYNDLINTNSIKTRITRLYKESAQCKFILLQGCIPPPTTSTGVWKVGSNKTISGTFDNKITLIVKGGNLTIDGLKGSKSIGIIAIDTNIEIKGKNSNIAIYAYDTGGSKDGIVSFTQKEKIDFTGAIVAENIKLNGNGGDIDWAPDLQKYVPEGFSEILKPIISEKAP